MWPFVELPNILLPPCTLYCSQGFPSILSRIEQQIYLRETCRPLYTLRNLIVKCQKGVKY